MVGDKKTLKFQMMMSPEEAEQLDDWMFKKRLRSRAEAIRRLYQIGLAFDEDRGEIADLVSTKLPELMEKITNGLSVLPVQVNSEQDLDFVRFLEVAAELAVTSGKLAGMVSSAIYGSQVGERLGALDALRDDLTSAAERLSKDQSAFRKTRRSTGFATVKPERGSEE